MAYKSMQGSIGACLMITTFTSNAALIGIMPATPGGTDFQAYYDDIADITWTADANLAATETFLATGLTLSDGGIETYSVMTGWIEAMNNTNGGAGYLGVTGWRFPFTPTTDPVTTTLSPREISCLATQSTSRTIS